jgi:peptidoglycan/LPS O-acetylase OafA/YrhL
MLVLCFLAGNIFFLFKDVIPARPMLLAAALVGFWASYCIPQLALLIGVLSATYIVVYLGLCRIPRVPLLQTGDYSYGIYLYSFPIQQTIAWALPELRNWYWNLLIAAPVTILFAAISWHLIEKPALSLRKKLVALPPQQSAVAVSG